MSKITKFKVGDLVKIVSDVGVHHTGKIGTVCTIIEVIPSSSVETEYSTTIGWGYIRESRLEFVTSETPTVVEAVKVETIVPVVAKDELTVEEALKLLDLLKTQAAMFKSYGDKVVIRNANVVVIIQRPGTWVDLVPNVSKSEG